MKTLVITGGSRGIGKATVKYFLANGWTVITSSTSGQLDYSDANLSVHQLDLANPGSIKNFVAALKANGTNIDILINNAGISVEEEDLISLDALRKTLEVNLVGTIDFTRQIFPLITNGGILISLSSQMASLTRDYDYDYPSYRISKTALNMFTRAIFSHPQIKEKGIKVYSFDPGWVKTDMGGMDAPRQPEEPAAELFNLAKSDLPSGEFYLGLNKRSW